MIRTKMVPFLCIVIIMVFSGSFSYSADYSDKSSEDNSDIDENEDEPDVFKDIEKSMAYGIWLNQKILETLGEDPSFEAVYNYLESDQCIVNIFVGGKDFSISSNDDSIFISLHLLDDKNADSQDVIDEEMESHEEYNLPDDLTVEEYNMIWIAHFVYYAAFLCVEMNNQDEIDEDLLTENRTGIECQVMGYDNLYRMIMWEGKYDSDDTSYRREYLYDAPDYFVKCFPEFEYGYK